MGGGLLTVTAMGNKNHAAHHQTWTSNTEDLSWTSNTEDLSWTNNTEDLSLTSNTEDLSWTSNTEDLSWTNKITGTRKTQQCLNFLRKLKS